MIKVLSFTLIVLSLTSCIEPEGAVEATKKEDIKTEGGLFKRSASGGVAAKNFTQINLTYSNLTKVPTYNESVLAEYKAIELQLPASTDPESLNGFNQLSSTRLAFAYCDVFLDKGEVYGMFSSNSADVNSKVMINLFADLDFDNNEAHQEFKSHVVEILNNRGIDSTGTNVQLIQVSNKKSLLKLGCAAVLSSSYLTLI